MDKFKIYTREELHSKSKDEIIDIYFDTVHYFLNKIEKLEKRIEELEARIDGPKKNSQNSSKPPSTDYKSNKGKKANRRGARPGHKANHKKLRENPDITNTYHVCSCPDCGYDLSHSQSNQYETRQWIEIPLIKILVVEQKRQFTTCPICHKTVYASVPEEETINPKEHIGPNLKTLIGILKYKYKLSFRNIADFINTFSDNTISIGTIDNILTELSAQGETLYNSIKQALRKSDWIGADETGWRVNGDNWWCWAFQNEHLTYYTIEPSRGSKVPIDVLGDEYKGILLSDFYSSYSPVKVRLKAKCNEHLKRDLKYAILQEQKLGVENGFSSRMLCLLDRMLMFRRIFINSPPSKHFKNIRKAWKQELEQLLNMTTICPESRRLQNRIRKHYNEIFLFIDVPTVPPNNNLSEQAERKMVIYRKMSNGSQSELGSKRISIGMSLIETARKQKADIIKLFRNLFENKLEEAFEFS